MPLELIAYWAAVLFGVLGAARVIDIIWKDFFDPDPADGN